MSIPMLRLLSLLDGAGFEEIKNGKIMRGGLRFCVVYGDPNGNDIKADGGWEWSVYLAGSHSYIPSEGRFGRMQTW